MRLGPLIATIIVLSNLAGVAVTFFYLMLGQVTGSSAVVEFGDRLSVHVLTCLVFVAVATAVAYRGTALTKRVQYVLVGFQLAVLAAVRGARRGQGRVRRRARHRRRTSSLAWLNVTQVPSFSAFTAGLSLSIFIYWGWDTCLTVNEETDGQRPHARPRRPADDGGHRRAPTSVSPSRAGVRRRRRPRGSAWATRRPSDNVFAALAGPVHGARPGVAAVPRRAGQLGVLACRRPSSRRPARCWRWRPTAPCRQRFARVHPVTRRPSFATVTCGVAAGAFYALMVLVSENVLVDTIYALGLMICFYYGLTAAACVWYFRGELRRSPRDLLVKGVVPGLGALSCWRPSSCRRRSTRPTRPTAAARRSSASAASSSSASACCSSGVVLALVRRTTDPAFFRGETLHTDTPSLVLPD